MPQSYIAHVRKSDQVEQSVYTHLTETAEIAAQLAAKLNLDAAGKLLGLMHDFGKYSQSFQKYIMATTGIDPDADVEYYRFPITAVAIHTYEVIFVIENK